MSKVLIYCKSCKKEIEVYQKLLDISKGKYCSRKCYELGKRKQTSYNRVCSKCKVVKNLSEFGRKSKGNRTLCNSYCNKCRAKSQFVKRGEIHYRWMISSGQAIKKMGEKWWDITEEEYRVLLSQNCHYCKGPLNRSGVGLDRKCNNVGYITSNVVPCCGQCNIVKNKFFTYEEMMLLSPVLQKIRQEKLDVCNGTI